MDGEIASKGVSCLSSFKTLQVLLKPREDLQQLVSSTLLADELGRFKIWAGNIGALQSGPSSLDARLKEASHVRQAILRLLQDLSQALTEACQIASGERGSRVESPTQEPDLEFQSDSSVSSDSSEDSESHAPKSEFQELFYSIVESLTGLLKLSIVIRHASPKDRYAKSTRLEPLDDSFDIGHIWQKFPSARSQPWLVERLGRAVTRRRQHLRYCRAHRDKLAKNLTALDKSETRTNAKNIYSEGAPEILKRAEGTDSFKPAHSVSIHPSTLNETQASSLLRPINLTKDLEDLEAPSESGLSERSYATSAGDTGLNYLKCPTAPEAGTDGQPFECPYCYTIQSTKGANSWKKHVYSDLQPYVCTFENCSSKLYASRQEWFDHESQTHRIERMCTKCNVMSNSDLELKTHLEQKHHEVFVPAQLEALLEKCKRPSNAISPTDCPLCTEWAESIRAKTELPPNEELFVTPERFCSHLGKHLEQIALFALPKQYDKDDEIDSNIPASHHSQSEQDDKSDEVDSKIPAFHRSKNDYRGKPDFWLCHNCSESMSIDINPSCFGCEHIRCEQCEVLGGATTDQYTLRQISPEQTKWIYERDKNNAHGPLSGHQMHAEWKELDLSPRVLVKLVGKTDFFPLGKLVSLSSKSPTKVDGPFLETYMVSADGYLIIPALPERHGSSGSPISLVRSTSSSRLERRARGARATGAMGQDVLEREHIDQVPQDHVIAPRSIYIDNWATFYDISDQALGTFDQSEISLQILLHDVIQSEHGFVKTQGLHLDYLHRVIEFLQSQDQSTPEFRIGELFMPLQIIRQFSDIVDRIKQLHEELQERLLLRQSEQGPWVEGFSDLFSDFYQRARPTYREYGRLCPKLMWRVSHAQNTVIGFRGFVDKLPEVVSYQRRELSVETCLSSPFERLQRYEDILKRMKEIYRDIMAPIQISTDTRESPRSYRQGEFLDRGEVEVHGVDKTYRKRSSIQRRTKNAADQNLSSMTVQTSKTKNLKKSFTQASATAEAIKEQQMFQQSVKIEVDEGNRTTQLREVQVFLEKDQVEPRKILTEESNISLLYRANVAVHIDVDGKDWTNYHVIVLNRHIFLALPISSEPQPSPKAGINSQFMKWRASRIHLQKPPIHLRDYKISSVSTKKKKSLVQSLLNGGFVSSLAERFTVTLNATSGDTSITERGTIIFIFSSEEEQSKLWKVLDSALKKIAEETAYSNAVKNTVDGQGGLDQPVQTDANLRNVYSQPDERPSGNKVEVEIEQTTSDAMNTEKKVQTMESPEEAVTKAQRFRSEGSNSQAVAECEKVLDHYLDLRSRLSTTDANLTGPGLQSHLGEAGFVLSQILMEMGTNVSSLDMPLFARIGAALGAVFLTQRKQQEGIAAVEIALKNLDKIDKDDLAPVLKILEKTGTLYMSLSLHEEAESLYKRKLYVERSRLGANHLSTLMTTDELVQLYSLQNRTSEATKLRSVALKGYTKSLFLVVGTESADQIARLLAKGADARAIDNDGNTALHLAVLARNDAVVQVLIAAGAELKQQNAAGQTAIFLAVHHGFEDTVRVLLKNGADIHETNAFESTLLHVATDRIKNAMAKFLLQNGVKVNEKASYEEGADIRDWRRNGSTALHIAALYGDDVCTRLLLNFGAEPNARKGDGKTPLYVAAFRGHLACARILLDHTAKAGLENPDLQSAFIPASRGGHLGCLGVLLDHGVDIAAADEHLNTALHITVSRGFNSCARMLLERGADVEAVNYFKETPLALAPTNISRPAFELLLGYGANIEARNRMGATALLRAAQRGDSDCLRTLLDLGADIDARDASMRTALSFSVISEHLECAKILLERGADSFIQDNTGLTPLHEATRRKSKLLIKLLLQKGANSQGRDWNERTALSIAVECLSQLEEGDPTAKEMIRDVIQPLLDADVISGDEHERSALQLAVMKNESHLVQLLLKKGANINEKDASGMTALHSAADNKEDFPVVAGFLLYFGASATTEDNMGRTPLHLAARRGNEHVIIRLLDAGAAINTPDHRGDTALHFAVEEGQQQTVDLLLKGGAHVDAGNKEGRTALHLAIQRGERFHEIVGTAFRSAFFALEIKVVESLLEKGANVNAQDSHGTTPLQLAVREKNHGIVKLLLNSGADVNARDHEGLTALHITVQTDEEDILETLLASGADIDLPIGDGIHKGMTVLHAKALNADETAVKILLEYGARVDLAGRMSEFGHFWERKQEFGGVFKLLRDADAAYRWVCRDGLVEASKNSTRPRLPEIPILHCQDCFDGKLYDDYASAASHLQKTHFRTTSIESRVSEDEILNYWLCRWRPSKASPKPPIIQGRDELGLGSYT